MLPEPPETGGKALAIFQGVLSSKSQLFEPTFVSEALRIGQDSFIQCLERNEHKGNSDLGGRAAKQKPLCGCSVWLVVNRAA